MGKRVEDENAGQGFVEPFFYLHDKPARSGVLEAELRQVTRRYGQQDRLQYRAKKRNTDGDQQVNE